MGDDKKHKKNLDEKKEESYHDDVTVEPTKEDGEETALAEKLKALRGKLKECEQERQEYLAGWQRSKADFINQKREQEALRKELLEFANKNLIDELLPVLDTFQMAMSNKEAWEAVTPNWRKGIEHIYGKFLDVLKGHGGELIGASGEAFNPETHAAIETVPTEVASEDGKVATVLQQGFKLKEKVLRPARVTVYTYRSN